MREMAFVMRWQVRLADRRPNERTMSIYKKNYASSNQGNGNLSDQQEFHGRTALSPSCTGNISGLWQ